MSFNKMFLDKNRFIDMYESGEVGVILKYDAIIYEDDESYEYVKLYEKGDFNKLKKLLTKNVKKNK